MVAGARAKVDDRTGAASRARLRAERLRRERLAQPPVVPRAKERLAGLDHRSRVRFAPTATAREQAHVALACDVERVASRAAQHTLALLELARADRTTEEAGGRTEHRGILAAMKVIRNVHVRPRFATEWLEP
jgi:hypothetical protein